MKHFIEPYLDRIKVEYEDFYNLEFNNKRYWRWSTLNSNIIITNDQPTDRKVKISFFLKMPIKMEENKVSIIVNNQKFEYIFDSSKKEIKIDLVFELKKGINKIIFKSKSFIQNLPKDKREISFGIFDYSFDFLDYKKKRVILHGGFEKTGTTSLQKFLFENKEKLLEKKLYYPFMYDINHWFLVTYCIDEDKNSDMVYRNNLHTVENRKLFKKLFKNYITQQIKSIGRDIETVVFSSEHFHSNINNLEETKRVKEFLDEFFNDIKIIFYLRRQDKLAVSHYSTRIKSGEYSLEIFLKDKDYYYNFYEIIKRWSEIFTKEALILKVFEKDKLKNKNIIDDFFDTLKIDIKEFEIDKYFVNESLSAFEIMVLLFINKYINGNNDWFRNKDKISIELISYFVNNFKFDNNKKILPSKKEAIDFYKTYKKSNELLYKEFFNNNEIFSMDFDFYPKNKMLKSFVSRNKHIEEIIKTFIGFLEKNKIIQKDYYK